MKLIFTASLVFALTACNNQPTVTERFKRVETKELILLDQHGASYELQVDESGNVKAIKVNEPD